MARRFFMPKLRKGAKARNATGQTAVEEEKEKEMLHLRQGENEAQCSLPLKGASIYLLPSNFDGSGNNRNSEWTTTVEALGGTLVKDLDQATHALWFGEQIQERQEQNTTATNHSPSNHSFPSPPSLIDDIGQCEAKQIPIVDAALWLERISGLLPGEHWSELDVAAYIPPLDFIQQNQPKTEIGLGQTTSSSPPSAMNWEPTNRIEDIPMENLLVSPPEPHHYHRHRRRRSDQSDQLSAAMSQTWKMLIVETPDEVESSEIQRAIELSMLDCALVLRSPSTTTKNLLNNVAHQKETTKMTPLEILGCSEDSNVAQIRSAYRRKALITHPDRKGGSQEAFSRVLGAYRELLDEHMTVEKKKDYQDNNDSTSPLIKNTAHWDAELAEHSSLVQELFQSHGVNLSANIQKQQTALKNLGLCVRDAGSSNINEKNERIANSCFYLSLATSYLTGIGATSSDIYNDDRDDNVDATMKDAEDALVGEMALQLKRIIEAAVCQAHPEWAAQGKVGEHVQAFSDFLVYVLDSSAIVSDWAVVIFDAASGFVDVYKGKLYDEAARAHTITIQYIPGHYQALIPAGEALRPTLVELLSQLDEQNVFYVLTDGAA